MRALSTEPRWTIRTPEPGTVHLLRSEIDCSPLVATVLANRGITDADEARYFLEPSVDSFHDPTTLPDIAEAIERLAAGVEDGEQIVVFGDRDVDGICGSAILVNLFDNLGANVGWYIPGKWDGYGLTSEAVEELIDREVDLLVTVDCGTAAIDEIRRLSDHDVDVVVTDHHDPKNERPPAVACVNPRRADSDYPHEDLAAGAIAYKVGEALLQSLNVTSDVEYRSFALALATLATIGDYVDLNLENRSIARVGYEQLVDCDHSGIADVVSHCEITSIREIRWSLVPLLNAAQEDESGNLLLELLFTLDSDRRTDILQELEGYRERRREQRRERKSHLEECYLDQVSPLDEETPVVFVETAQYVGGSAMHDLSEQVGRPVIAYRQKGDHLTGGGRSEPDVDLIDLFEECADFLENYWGHPGAAGFTVAVERVERFKRKVTQRVRRTYDVEDFRPTVDIDGVLEPERVDAELATEIDRLRPFGPGNDEPLFLLESITFEQSESFGNQDRHLRLISNDVDSVEFVYWNGANELDPVPLCCDVVGTIGLDSYTDSTRVNIQHIREAE